MRRYVKAKQGETPAYTNKILKQEIKRGENWDVGYNIDFFVNGNILMLAIKFMFSDLFCSVLFLRLFLVLE